MDVEVRSLNPWAWVSWPEHEGRYLDYPVWGWIRARGYARDEHGGRSWQRVFPVVSPPVLPRVDLDEFQTFG